MIVRKFLAVLFVVGALGAGAPAFAQGVMRPAAPAVDTFEDGDCRLKLFGATSESGAMRVTLVYEDAETRTLESVTVDPDLVATTEAELFKTFLEKIDPAFLSFVRATLADRLLHLKAEPHPIDVAESTLFFKRKVIFEEARLSE